MALNRQLVPVQLRALAQKSPSQAGVTGTLSTLQNMIALKGDGDGLEVWPRPGVSALSRTVDSGSLTAGKRLSTLGGALLLQDGSQLWRRATDEWHLVGQMPIIGVQSTPVASSTSAVGSADTVYVGGYTVSAYTTNPGVSSGAVVMLVTDANGATVLVQTLDTGVVGSARIVACGQYAVVVYTKVSNALGMWRFDSANPMGVAGATLSTTAFGRIDVQAVGASGNVVVSWLSTATSTYHLQLVAASTLTGGTQVDTTVAGVSAFSLMTNDWSTNVIYAAWGGTGSFGINVSRFDGATLATIGSSVFDSTTTFVYNVAGIRSGATVQVFATTSPDGSSAVTNPIDYRIVTSLGVGNSTVMRGMVLCSRVISANGTFYAMVSYRGTNQGTYFLLDLLTSRTVARALDDLAFTGEIVANLAVGATANAWVTAGLRVVASATGGAAYIGASAITFTNLDTSIGRGVELNGGLHFPGAQPYLYDGQVLVEDGFPIAAEQPDTPTQSVFGGSSLTPLATYTIRIVYAWTDAAGNLHRSAPSTPLPVTLLGSNNQLGLSIPTLRNTLKSGVIIEIYLTVANDPGAAYYQIVPFGTPLLNDPTVDRVSYTVNTPDATIVGGEPLYTDGNVLDNIAPPPCKAFASHRGRLLASGVDGDSQSIWFSKDVSPGFGIAFSDALVSRLQAAADPIVALTSMDAFAVVCTRGGTTWASSDQYPDDTGVGGVLSFQQYSSMVGCSGTGLMARTDDGVTMWGGSAGATANVPPKNLWLISRGLAFEYLGGAIENDAQGFTPLAALAVPAQNQLRFIGTDANGVSCALVYETVFKTWAVWRYTQQATGLVDAVLWNGAAAYLCSDGTVLTENATGYDDLGVAGSVPHVVTLSGVQFGGIGGYVRIYGGNATGRVLGTGGFTFRIDQTSDLAAIARKTIAIAGADTTLNAEWDPGTNGKCSTYTVSFSDATNGGNTAWTLAAVGFSVGVKPGMDRKPPARRMT